MYILEDEQVEKHLKDKGIINRIVIVCVVTEIFLMQKAGNNFTSKQEAFDSVNIAARRYAKTITQ